MKQKETHGAGNRHGTNLRTSHSTDFLPTTDGRSSVMIGGGGIGTMGGLEGRFLCECGSILFTPLPPYNIHSQAMPLGIFIQNW